MRSKEKVLSSKEPSLDEKKVKFKPLEADNVNNFEENDATNLRSSEVPDTNSNDSSMNNVDDKAKETNSSTPEQKQCFLQTDTPEIIPSIAKQTGSPQSNPEDLLEPSLNVKDNVRGSVKSSPEDDVPESKQLSSKNEEVIIRAAEQTNILKTNDFYKDDKSLTEETNKNEKSPNIRINKPKNKEKVDVEEKLFVDAKKNLKI